MTTPNLSEQEREALGKLNRATEWVIHWARFVMARKGYLFLEEKVIQETGVYVWSDPILDEEDSIAVFRLKAGGYFYRLEAIHAQQIDGIEYEYWVVHVSARLNVTAVSGCLFYITSVREDAEFGRYGARRDILASDSQYIPAFETEGGTIFDLPLDDMRVLFGLQAWEFPACFAGTTLPATEIIAVPDGTFVARAAK